MTKNHEYERSLKECEIKLGGKKLMCVEKNNFMSLCFPY